MTRSLYRYRGTFKATLFAIAIVLPIVFLYYTQVQVAELQEQSRDFQKLRVQLFAESINNDDIVDINFFFTNIIQNTDYPVIYCDADSNPQFWVNTSIPHSTQATRDPKIVSVLKQQMQDFAEVNPPIAITYENNLLGLYYYGESQIIRRLRLLPYFEIAAVALFILIGYLGFSSIRKNEERLIWVGMAKETAHQLGTPLSAQIGWLEYLKSSPESLKKVLPELEKDLKRLQIITNRFSQIGSKPELKTENPFELIGETVQYFRNRIPQKNGGTRILSELDPNLTRLQLNSELFSWVLENLIKNALDAMGSKGGTITITTGMENTRQAFVDVADTGKGIPAARRKDIFRPGYSTKKRGWGLGLSLARRIVEEYHGGRLLLKESKPGEGTTFRILLNLDPDSGT